MQGQEREGQHNPLILASIKAREVIDEITGEEVVLRATASNRLVELMRKLDEREETEEGRARSRRSGRSLAMNLSRWSLNEIATVMDHLVLYVPTELSDHALHGFMNELGRDFLGRFQAPTFPAQGD